MNYIKKIIKNIFIGENQKAIMMEIKCVCYQCGIPKMKNRFFYDKCHGWSIRCKRCDIKNAAINRKRHAIRKDKDVQEIKEAVNNDPTYMENGILWLAEMLTINILRQRNIKL